MGYKGEYAYWGIEGAFNAGNPASDPNIPFNPLVGLGPPKPKYSEETIYTFDSLEPTIIYSNELTPGEADIETVFKDPFLLLACFTHKVVGGTWVSGIGTIDADFSNIDDKDTLFIHYKQKDLVSTNHIHKTVRGVLPTAYKWVIEPGKLLKEVVSTKGLSFASVESAMACNNDFHDQRWGSGIGGWAKWDDTGLNGTGKRSARDMVIEWNDVAITGLKIKTATLALAIPHETEQFIDSLGHTLEWEGQRGYSLELAGKLNDLTQLEEVEKTYADKTKNTLKVYYDKTAGKEKYIQITKMYVADYEVIAIPEAGQLAEVTFTMKGGEDCVPSFSGKYDTLPDPSALITT